MAESSDGVSLACPPDQFAPATTVCRTAVNECDIEEFCTGTSADCPPDEHQPDGTPCDAEAGTCLSGICQPNGGCVPGTTGFCDGPSEGICDPGTRTCQDDGTWGPCEGVVGPQPEVCNGLDDDCDGLVDEDVICPNGGTCVEGECVCPAGMLECEGTCIDVLTDETNCGGCGQVCSGECIDGFCTGACGNGLCEAGETCDTCPDDCCP